MDEKQRHAFDQLAFDRREMKRQNGELHKRVTELEEQASVANIEETEKLKDQVKLLEERIGQYNLAETSVFKREFDVPYYERVKRAQNLLLKSKLDESSANALIARVLQTQDLNSRIDLLNEEVPNVSGMLGVLFDEIDNIRTRRGEALAHWKEHRASLEETQKRELQRETLVVSEKLARTAVEQATAQGNFMYRKAKDSEAWNKEVDERVQAARAVLRKGDPIEMSQYIVDGLAGRRLREMFVVERSRRLAAEDQLNAIRSARPGVAGGASSGSGGPVKKDNRTTDQVLTDIWGTAG
jgi:hypothetical protein